MEVLCGHGAVHHTPLKYASLLLLRSLLLSTVSGEGVKERTDRVLLTPWVKFLWESYRNILELLKNNSAVKNIYADVAKKGLG